MKFNKNHYLLNNLFIKIMHYILNTTFTIGSNKPGPVGGKIGGPTRFGSVNTDSPKLTTAKFKPGTSYTLTYIKKLDDGVEYTFKSSYGDTVVEKFTNCNDADMFIASIKGEKLPNYESIYSKIRS